jgi:hypothetical protein
MHMKYCRFLQHYCSVMVQTVRKMVLSLNSCLLNWWLKNSCSLQPVLRIFLFGSGFGRLGPAPDSGLNKWPYLSFLACVKAKDTSGISWKYFLEHIFIKKNVRKKLTENLFGSGYGSGSGTGSRRFRKSDPVKNHLDPQHCV